MRAAARGFAAVECLIALGVLFPALCLAYESVRRSQQEAAIAVAVCRYVRVARWGGGIPGAERDFAAFTSTAFGPSAARELRVRGERETAANRGRGWKARVLVFFHPLWRFSFSGGTKQTFQWERECRSF